MITTPRVGGGQNSEKYWVSGSNILPITREKFIHNRRPNYFRSTYIIAKNCMEVLPEQKNISLDESKRNNILTTWNAYIRSYVEGNGMDTVFYPDLKTEVYILYYWGAPEDGKYSKWVQILTTMGGEY